MTIEVYTRVRLERLRTARPIVRCPTLSQCGAPSSSSAHLVGRQYASLEYGRVFTNFAVCLILRQIVIRTEPVVVMVWSPTALRCDAQARSIVLVLPNAHPEAFDDGCLGTYREV